MAENQANIFDQNELEERLRVLGERFEEFRGRL